MRDVVYQLEVNDGGFEDYVYYVGGIGYGFGGFK